MSVDDDEVAEVKTLWHLGIHMDVGARYLAALQKLGLDPECLFWAEDEVIGHPVLVLVTEQFDRVGPLELSRTLFKAHDHAGTPAELNPFILRLHSPQQALIREMEAVGTGDFLANAGTVRKTDGEGSLAPGFDLTQPADVLLSAGGMRFKPAWVYKWNIPARRSNIIGLRRRWHRFAENVDRLAA